MKVRVIVDPDACLGFGECVAFDPEAVELDDQGRARILLELDAQRAKLLCDACSDRALSIVTP